MRFMNSQIFSIMLGLLSFLILWYFGALLVDNQNIFPNVHTVLNALVNNFSIFLPHITSTFLSTVSTFLISFVIALLLGIIVSEFKLLKWAFEYPLIALQNIPKAAIVPAVYILSSNGIIKTRIIVGILICFFPIYENIKKGLSNDYTGLRNTLQTMGAPLRSILFRVKIPEACGYIFTGCKVGITYSLIGIIVAEMTIVSDGLGSQLMIFYNDSQTTMVFVSIFISSILGMFLYSAILLIEKLKYFEKYISSKYTNFI